MKVEQIYNIVNDVTKEMLGTSEIVDEQLKNITDIGTKVFDGGSDFVKSYVSNLINRIGKMVFSDRVYNPQTYGIMVDGWEYGSILAKTSATSLIEASPDESWELEKGSTYDVTIYYGGPEAETKYYNKRDNFEVKFSLQEKQIKQSFINAMEMNKFISFVWNEIKKSKDVKIAAIASRTINTLILEADKNGKSINLLEEYNETFGKTLKAAGCLLDKDFIRFAIYKISIISNRMEQIGTLFNGEGVPRFTPKENQKMVILSDLQAGADIYLQADTYHNELTKLSSNVSVPYWQGSGLNYAFNDITTIKGTLTDNTHAELTGVLGVIFDDQACAITNEQEKVTSFYNPNGDFYNYWDKYIAQSMVDVSENAFVFYVKDPEE